MSENTQKDYQLAMFVNPADEQAVIRDAKRFYKLDFPRSNFRPIQHAFAVTKKLYAGRVKGYQACSVEYHNYEHCLAVFVATSRLLDGCLLSGLGMDADRAEEVLIAALLHDSGYIRLRSDENGTGAQYTQIHVDRSAELAIREASLFGLSRESAQRIARMILGTDLGRAWESLLFEDEEELLGAEILASADLIGQMADRAYLEKLLFLYREFREAGIQGYETAFDILRKTAGFYSSTKRRLEGPLGRVSDKSRRHFSARYGVDHDLYNEAIERQMNYLVGIMSDDSSNFRTKLKRMDFSAIEGRGA